MSTLQPESEGFSDSDRHNQRPSPITAIPVTKAIIAKNIEKVFQTPAGIFQILNCINLEICQGNVQMLMGPSGSGKTTLLLILSGLLSPTSGSVYLLGEEITKMSKRKLTQFRLHNIGFIAQDFNLFPALTAAENVIFALALKGIHGRKASQQTQFLLEQVGLAERAKQLPRELSGGQQQRVAIARALAGNPGLIMADEPTAALDSENGRVVITLLRQLAQEKGCTVLMVTHDPRVIDVTDKLIYLDDGKIALTPETRYDL